MSHLLENTLIKLLAVRPACLLLPTSWSQHSTTLHGLAERINHPQVAHGVKRLDERNSRLQQSSKVAPVASTTSAGRVYRILDNVDYNKMVRIDEVSTDCMEVIPHPVNLVSALLQWACSCYREGSYRVCLATRLLRRWAHLGADIYECVTTYLEGMSWAKSGDSRMVFKIISELVRSRTFAAGRYMQWLIATGSIAQNLDLSLVRNLFLHAGCNAHQQLACGVARTSDHRNTHQWITRSSTHSARNASPWNSSFGRLGRADFESSQACYLAANACVVQHGLFRVGPS